VRITVDTIARWRARLPVMLGVVCLAALPIALRGQTATTDEVKAAFLFNFAKFVEWPAARGTGSLSIGVLGNDNLGESLREIVRGKTVNGRPLASRRVTADDDLASLHLLFVGTSEKMRVADVLKRVEGGSVLTVSDVDKFCHQGGVIALTQEGNHVRFDINLDAADRSKLKVSSKLLTLARTVHPARAAGER
jgi:hypothetical protein